MELLIFSSLSVREFNPREACECLTPPTPSHPTPSSSHTPPPPPVSEAISPFRLKKLGLSPTLETSCIMLPSQARPLSFSLKLPSGRKKNAGRQRCSLNDPYQWLKGHLSTCKLFLSLETVGHTCRLSVTSVYRTEFISPWASNCSVTGFFLHIFSVYHRKDYTNSYTSNMNTGS